MDLEADSAPDSELDQYSDQDSDAGQDPDQDHNSDQDHDMQAFALAAILISSPPQIRTRTSS